MGPCIEMERGRGRERESKGAREEGREGHRLEAG